MNDQRLFIYKILKIWFSTDKYIDHILTFDKTNFKQVEKRFITNIIFGVIQWHLQLEFILKKFYKRPPSMNIKILLFIGTYELLFLNNTKDYATVHSIVEMSKKLEKRSTAFINAILRKVIKFRENGSWEKFKNNKNIPVNIKYSFPKWLIKKLQKDFKDNTNSLLQIFNEEPLQMIRIVDTEKREEIISEMKDMKIYKNENIYDNNFIEVTSFQQILDHSFFTNGGITIQDVSTSFPVKLLLQDNPKSVVDVCSAPGGKLFYLRENLSKNVPIFAYDIDKYRLKKTEGNAKRLSLSNINYKNADAQNFRFPEATHFLIDAPCSGLGVIRKKPDLRWRREEKDISELIDIQKNILQNVSKYVKNNGAIIYSTCTIGDDENWNIINDFLEHHKNFKIEKANEEIIPSELIDSNGAIKTLPHLHFCEGSFAVMLKKH
ncbi:MAG: 16S rRNA (cytosine(967)-C(5))-methyltransferase RsmB [Candidatus Marinimicrobia bacterium]|nr:16S rRNA (cytosine(967)-C(5))-methyltransferase RsmB [Candidatus Neomarinimicrobiota bacterium]